MAGYSSYEICRMLESVMDLELYLENNIYCEVSDDQTSWFAEYQGSHTWTSRVLNQRTVIHNGDKDRV